MRPFHCAALLLFAALVIAAAASVAAQRRPSAVKGTTVLVRLLPQTAEQGYVGEERCSFCHSSELTQFHKTSHARVVSESKQPMNCESCHGPGKPHADAEEAASGDDALMAAAKQLIFAFHGTVQENTSPCLSCHITSRSQLAYSHSLHAATAVACQTCHSTHLVEAAAPEKAPPELQTALGHFYNVPQLALEQRWLRESLLREGQPVLCYSCHASVRAQFALPFHHRVDEGSRKCTDCHNPHGSENLASLTAPGWETCTKCHMDKHGPFLFEHAAVRVEGCAICHTPHGAASRFLLNRRESRFLCLQCHGDPHSQQEQVAVPHSRFGFQARGDCTRCHAAIHGSNSNQFFLQ